MRIALESPHQPEVVALVEALDAFSNGLTPPESRHQVDLSALAGPDALFAVARGDDGAAIGCAGIVLAPAYGELKRMFVLPAFRAGGVGSALLRFLEVAAARRGCTTLMLETGDQHELAQRTYRRNGFTVRGPFGAYAPDPRSVFMEKALPAPAMLEVSLSEVDPPLAELEGRLPLPITLLRELPGDDRPDYWLGALERPLSPVAGERSAPVTHVVLAARLMGTRIQAGARDLAVALAWVVDATLLDDARLDFRKCRYVAIGTADVGRARAPADPPRHQERP